TETGRTFVQDAPSPLQETLADSLTQLSPLEQATISLSLERVVSMMEAEKLDAAPILQSGDIASK
ncbi:MAG: MarR family transcriptional regulator, partial [Pseudomonadota bacterium]